MKRIEITDHKTICQNPDSVYRYFAWPTVGRLPDGTLAMLCSGFRRNHVDPFGKLTMCYSFNEGKTWTLPAVVLDTPLDDRDGGIAVFGKNKDRVMVTTFNNSIQFQQWAVDEFMIPQNRSDCALRQEYLNMLKRDKAEVEDRFFGSLYKISDDGGYTFSDFKKVPVTCPHGPCPLPSGDLIYIGEKHEDFFPKRTDFNIYAYKLNGDDEFEKIGVIENNTDNIWDEPYAFAVTDEHIIVHIRVENEKTGLGCIMQSESYDGGHTFTEPHRINEHGFPAHIIKHSSGTLISVYSYRKDNTGSRAIFSKDNGKTWSDEYVLDDSGWHWDLGYPSCVELKDGRILTIYYKFSYNPENSREWSHINQFVWEIPVEFK